MTAAIELEGVTRAFGAVKAVDSLSLRVGRGTIFGFLGVNGAGKTTTIKMVLASATCRRSPTTTPTSTPSS